ncbi:MAG TPA: RNA-guided endonuclease TnpB family protein [Ktedonobacteraceae bacterium]|nr:RNA-guided endonuclease TnpB family protein [Ktedonobacteraceae bacterium]
MGNRKAYKYRLYPTKKQAMRLQEVLDRCRELYNAALQERRDAYRMAQVSIGYNQQAAQLPEIKEIRPEYADIHSQVLQDTLKRLDKAFKAFFRRVKAGEKPGYPRFQAYGRYDSFTFPQSGFSLTHDHRVCLSKIGTLKVKIPQGKKANPPQGTIKTCTIKREGQHWFVIFTCEVEQELVSHPSEASAGIDLGLLHFATMSDGSTIENPRHLRRAEQKLQKLQEALARKTRGSKRRRKAAQVVGKNHRHIRNQRKDFHHKEARKLVNGYGVIVLEKLQPANMSKRPKPSGMRQQGTPCPTGPVPKLASTSPSVMLVGVNFNRSWRTRQRGPVRASCSSPPGTPARSPAQTCPTPVYPRGTRADRPFLLCLGHETDLSDPATVRATMGAMFPRRFIRASKAEILHWKRRQQYVLVGTSPGALQDYQEYALIW